MAKTYPLGSERMDGWMDGGTLVRSELVSECVPGCTKVVCCGLLGCPLVELAYLCATNHLKATRVHIKLRWVLVGSHFITMCHFLLV